MPNDKKGGIEAIVELAIGIGAFMWEAFVLMKLWNWHAVPTLGCPVIGYAQAIGIDCVVGALTYRYIKQETKWEERIAEYLIYFALLLFVGWVVK